jgi:hypothetical protein
MMPSALAVFGLMAGPIRSGLMSQLDHSRSNLGCPRHVRFTPLATKLQTSLEVRFVPEAEVPKSR